IARLGSGDILGEMSLVEKRPPSVRFSATGAGTVLAVTQASLRERLATEPAFAARFYRALAVFLSDRLRSTVATLGYGGETEDALARFEAENELAEGLLDTLHVAGDRMRRLTELLAGGR
ncbi:MAG: cyclic nucleotide-binding protein, partial [Alphaproteobacteria bacterium]